ncbi:MAG: Cna B-type domain-containing protein [Christensenellales bacterium]
MTEYNQNNTKTGRTWRVTNDANGAAVITLDYPYDDINGFNNYLNKTYTYKLSEEQGTGQYQYDTTEYTFTVGFDYNETDTGKTLKPEIKQAEYANATFAFTNKMETVNVAGRKTWNDNGDQDGVRPDSIIISLMKNSQVLQSKTVTAEDDWAWNFENLPKYENGEEINYTIIEDAVENYTTVYRGYDVENQYTPKKTSLTVTKSWDDKGNQDGIRPNSITVKLFANGQDTGKTLTLNSANQWRGDFTDLDEFSAGEKIAYTVAEVSVPGYISVITGTPAEGYVITNTHTPAVTEVAGRKTWKDNNDQDGVRPDNVTVKLFANGEDTGKTLTLNASNQWTGSFTELDQYANGEEIRYTVQEAAVDGYEADVAGSQKEGFVLINTHIPEMTKVEGRKIWNDNGNAFNARPDSINIMLMKNGKQYESMVVTADDDWTWSLGNLPKYENGEEIIYSVVETAVDGYTTEYDGYDVINTYNAEKTSITVVKAWVDNNNAENMRPGKVTIKLFADGKDTGKTLILDAGNRWTGSFTDLDKYVDGKLVAYTVQEEAVDGYNTVITGSMEKGFTVTNSHTSVPKTGDTATSLPWLVLMMISGLAVVFIGVVAKKQKRTAR